MASANMPLGTEKPFIFGYLCILEAIRRRNSEECRLRIQAHMMKSHGKSDIDWSNSEPPGNLYRHATKNRCSKAARDGDIATWFRWPWRLFLRASGQMDQALIEAENRLPKQCCQSRLSPA